MYRSHNEIFQQGETLQKTFDRLNQLKEKIRAFFNQEGYGDILFIACGSSYWASRSLSMVFTTLTGMRSFAVTSGDILLNTGYYKKAFRQPLIVALTRSGRPTETLTAIRFLKAHFGSKVLSVTGYPGSPVSESSDFNVELPWITEESICQTRSFSNLYLAGVMISAFMGMDDALPGELNAYIRSFKEIASGVERQISMVIQDFRESSSLNVLANGILYGVGIEGATINVEMAAFPSWYFGTLEFRHGPVVLVNEKSLVVIISKREDAEYERSLVDEIKKRGGRVMVISNHAELKNADYSFHIQASRAEVIALFSVFVLQGLAYYKAVDLNLDPDKPKDLDQWISIEAKGSGNVGKEQ